MRLRLHAMLACSALAVNLPGCTGMMTQQAITAFTQGVEARDLNNLKQHASVRFDEMALRHAESAKDLKLIKVPTGKLTVASIEDLGDRRVVKVEVGESKKPVEYHLARDPKTGRWVVDDIMITQQAGRDGMTSRSVTDQMNLVCSIRETFEEWQSRDRGRVISVTTPELAKQLEDLPPAWLDRVTTRVAGEGPLRSLNPEILMQDDKAVVKLKRGADTVMLDFRLHDGKWLLSDAAIPDGQDDDIRSVSKLCAALSQARKFLEAYAAGDKAVLAEVATKEFESNCLATADLTRFPLPVVDLLTKPFKVRHQTNRVDVLLDIDDSTYTVNVLWPMGKEDHTGLSSEASLTPCVEELTIYDRKAGQVKRLSAMFRSQAVVQLYSELLASGDAAKIKHLSSSEFNDVVWKNFPPEILNGVRVPEIEAASPKLISTVFQGPVTEVTVMQGKWALTYILHTEGGRLVVDDVLMPTVGRPNSLKKHLQLLAPIYAFQEGLRKGDLNALMAASGKGLDHIVWQQVRETPDIGINVRDRLSLPIVGLKPGDTQARVTLSDGTRVAEVDLEAEQGRFVVADVKFVEGPEETPMALLQSMRKQIASEMQVRNSQDVLPARYEEHVDHEQLVQPL